MKKTVVLALCLAVLLSAAGCADLSKKEYYVEEEYTAELPHSEEDDVDDTISNYSALKRAITRLVSEHVSSAELQFQNYDGSIGQDISAACWEVKSSTALGAFAVDYISYDTTRIVSYYQAEIYITYKRTAEQVAALEAMTNLRALFDRVAVALEAGQTYLVLEVNAASATSEEIKNSVRDAYYANAQACPVLPTVEVSLFPETGVDRIAEITLDYGCTAEELSKLRQELLEACALLTEDLMPPEEESEDISEDKLPPGEAGTAASVRQADLAFTLAERLTDVCTPDETAADTAYDALVLGTASSEGVAMAYEAMCQAVGIECQVVSGRLGAQEHFWNIVTVDDIFAHVDVSRWSMGSSSVFLLTDAQMLSEYWWDTSLYPVCGTNYDYFGVATAKPSDDPEAAALRA